MKDKDKTKEQLITELEEIRHHVTQLDVSGSKSRVEIQQLIDAFPFYVMLVSADHHILMANEMLKQTTGIDPKHIIGGYCPKVVHGLDGPFPGCPLEEANKAGHGIERELFDSGSGRWVRSSAFPSSLRTHDDQTIFIHFTQDITERKQAEEENRRNYDIQQVLNSLLHLALEDISLEGILRKALELILSIPWLALESRGAIFLVEDDPEVLVMKAQNKLAKPIREACSRLPFGRCLCGRAALTQEIQFADHVDERHDIRYKGMIPHGHYCVPILFAGKTLGVINTYLKEGRRSEQRELEFLAAVANTLAGIIVRKRAEEEKHKVEAQLFQSQKMEAIGALTGGVAHDFNNLLTAILGFSELASASLGDNEPVRKDIEEVQAAAKRAASLTRQLLAFSRREVLQPKIMSLNALVTDMEKMLRRLIGEDIELVSVLEPKLRNLKADPGQIEQVIMNLVVNAKDAMPEGGKITIKTENITVNEEYCKFYPDAREGTFVSLMVEDTGAGIDKEVISHIFEPFFTTKELGKGTGLGLSVTYGVVRQHEGWINVYSEPGQGTIFRVYLPVVPAEAIAQTDDNVSLGQFKGNGERILIVEDQDEIRKFATRVLGENGYVEFEAASAREALDIFTSENGEFHMVFSDVILRDKNGLELADQLRSLKRQLPILITSGYTDQKAHWPIIQERGFRFLQKPYSVTDLLQAIKETMKQAK
ncbi:ATP-binding protein [Chloroflexota bacterium]